VGLLYDLHGNAQLPWTIHVTNASYPKDKLILNPLDSIQDVFLNSVKEADCLRHGNTKRVLNLSKAELEQLWHGLQTKSHDEFWGVNKKLVEADSVRHVPLRLHVKGKGVLQDLVPPKDANGQPTTLSTALIKLGITGIAKSDGDGPKLRHLSRSVSDDASSDSLPTHASLETSAAQEYSMVHFHDAGKGRTCTLHGIGVPTDASLTWLSNCMAYPDGFLHIVVE